MLEAADTSEPFGPSEPAEDATIAIGVAFGVSAGAGASGAAGWGAYRAFDSRGNRG